jgi:hypothetical protein
MAVFIVARHMRPRRWYIRNTASRRQRRPRFRLTEVTCPHGQRAPRYGAADIRVAGGTRAARHVPNLTPTPMGQAVLGSTPSPSPSPGWLQSATPVGLRRRSTRVHRALILVIKRTEAPTASNSVERELRARTHSGPAITSAPSRVLTITCRR